MDSGSKAGDVPSLPGLRRRQRSLLEEPAGPFSAAAIEGLSELARDADAALADRLELLGEATRELEGPGSRRLRRTVREAAELREIAGTLTVESALPWLHSTRRVGDAAEHLADAGPPSEVVARAPFEAARAVLLERVVLSRIAEGRMIVEAVHCDPEAGDEASLLAQLTATPVVLEYPLLEAELVRRRQALVVDGEDGAARARRAFADVLEWDAYVAAPIILGGRPVGFLHGDRRPSEAPLGALEREALRRVADAFAAAFERAVLRQRLRTQRHELRQMASWADARTSELSDAAIDLAAGLEPTGAQAAIEARPVSSQVQELLTRREIEVLEQMVQGASNADIARALVVSESTVKFHVKNVLRKLNVSNRAEATSRYLRLAMRSQGG